MGVGGQGSQYTQKSHTLTFWSWETLKVLNVEVLTVYNDCTCMRVCVCACVCTFLRV